MSAPDDCSVQLGRIRGLSIRRLSFQSCTLTLSHSFLYVMDDSHLQDDPLVGELVRIKNYKQALKNLDKKLKRSPKDHALLVCSIDTFLFDYRPVRFH